MLPVQCDFSQQIETDIKRPFFFESGYNIGRSDRPDTAGLNGFRHLVYFFRQAT